MFSSKLSLGLSTSLALLGFSTAALAAPAQLSDAARAELREQIKRELMVEMKAQMMEEIKRELLAELTGVGGTNTLPAATPAVTTADKAKTRVVRVPYVPESMRREIRDQVKQEVLAQAKEERWGNPDTLPEWLGRFKFEGDVRLRYDSFQLSKDNTPSGPGNVNAAALLTRGADLTGANSNPFSTATPTVNSQEDFNRSRLRLRFGATAKISDTVSAGFRIATGSTSGPTSTNQTLGQGFNKYALVLDRGFITLNPTLGLSLSGGRIANPFFSTDLVWADDLNFEGVTAHFSQLVTPDITAFGTAGWFPLRTDNPGQTSPRDLTGIQAGINWHLGQTTDLKFAAAIYNYKGIEGQIEADRRYFTPAASDYGTRYEYPSGLRQRGNTLFIANSNAELATGVGTTYWGLASGFRELNLTGSLDVAQFDPVHVVLTGDYVKNLAFDRKKIAARTGATLIDGKNTGYLGKVTVGYPVIAEAGEWNVSMAYRWLGSDAVLDAFTNSDFGMGGTNSKGYILGGSYGIDKNTWISARWMGSQLIDSMAPKTSPTTSSSKFAVDLLQIDLNSKF